MLRHWVKKTCPLPEYRVVQPHTVPDLAQGKKISRNPVRSTSVFTLEENSSVARLSVARTAGRDREPTGFAF